jgi:putative addiction module component (TIGR02574 family)
MNKNEENILAAVLALPEDTRVKLVERLLESLGPETDEWDEATFGAELERRSAEIDQGKAEIVPWSELKKEAI